MNNERARYVWDYDLTQEQFDAMLEGTYEREWTTKSRLGRRTVDRMGALR